MSSRKCSRVTRTGAVLIVLIVGMMGWPSHLRAMPVAPSVVELTRSASVIAVVEIQQLQEKMIAARVIEVIKGENVPREMNILWDFENTVEVRVEHREIGERMIVFVNREENLFKTKFDDNSLVSAAQLVPRASSLDEYKRSVQQIMRFDAVFSTWEKADVLLEMLNGSYFSQQSALWIIYIDKPRDYPTERLVSPLTALARDDRNRLAPFAVQVLGRIADKTLIPTFIELLASKNVYVRETAFHILKDKTRAPLTFDPGGPEPQRTDDISKWSQWWQENKDHVQLRY